jgi:ubiquitin-large subunit ribosomal protein L40e
MEEEEEEENEDAVWALNAVRGMLHRERFLCADALAVELLGFLRFKACAYDTSSRYQYSCPAPVDEAWHALLMDTETYAQVCSALGEQFIHHTTSPPGDREVRVRRYAKALGVEWREDLDKPWAREAPPTLVFFTKDEVFASFEYASKISYKTDSAARKARWASAAAPAPETQGLSAVFVKSLTGQTLTFRVNLHGPLRDLFVLIQDRLGIPIDQIRLIFGGKQLDVDETFGRYNIQKETTFHMCMRLTGC